MVSCGYARDPRSGGGDIIPRRLKKVPEIYNLPSHTSFVDGLVQGIFARFGDDPLTLGDLLILLPNRRAVRALRDAFLRRAGGKSMILPRIEPIGDVDEDGLLLAGNMPQTTWNSDLAPPISTFSRQMLLMDIIKRWYQKRGENTPVMAQAAQLAGSLGQFLDHIQTENLTLTDLEKLVPEEYAAHWQLTLDFLKILTEHWPEILSLTGYSDAAARRNILLEGLAQQWLDAPPKHPVIAAGSTGSIPATASLLGVIARLPRGMVILPGLDRDMDRQSWDILGATHPQATMKHLLDVIGAGRDMVEDWIKSEDISPARRARSHLLAEVMRPAPTTDRWRSLDLNIEQATKGLVRLEAPGPVQEAGMIALMLRNILEIPGKTAALVTTDRQLARRVAGEMKRWHILIDDSAGVPLPNTPPGVFLRLVARMVADGLPPVALLAALKHPLAAGGQDVGKFRGKVRLCEEKILRGPRPAAGCDGMARAVKDSAELAEWWQGIADIISPFERAMQQDEIAFEDLLTLHIDMAEKLAAAQDKTGPERLWQHDAGEEAGKLMEELLLAAPALGKMTPEDYPALLDVFMRGVTVRPKYGQHPRLNIWGPMEARLQQADMVILAGLNEGSWPPEIPPDPWMSRPMRTTFGLPSLEQKIGLSAHDFVQAASAPQVVLIRSVKTEGTPTVKSRWLSRMDAIAPDGVPDEPKWLDWCRALDKAASEHKIPAPKPMPPLAVRPRKLSVTRIQKLMQDPYSIYAQYILKLRVLDPLDADPGAADRGNIIHEALDDFMSAHPEKLPPDAQGELIKIGHRHFDKYLDRPTVRAFWWPRFMQVANWFVEQEKTRRQSSKTVATEIKGMQIFDLPGGEFTLTAKADRIDLLADGSYSVIDYKTGTIPKSRQIHAGYAPQLPLEGLMLLAGNFDGLKAGPVSDLSYWKLQGGEEAGKVVSYNISAGRYQKMDVPQVIKSARDGLLRLVTTFDLSGTPYLNNPRPDNPGYGEYDHLARTKEWLGNDLEEGE